MNASGKTISWEASRSTASFASRCSLSSVAGVSLYTVEHCATDARMVGDDISSVSIELTKWRKGKHCHCGFTSASSQCGQKVYKHAAPNKKATCRNVKNTTFASGYATDIPPGIFAFVALFLRSLACMQSQGLPQQLVLLLFPSPFLNCSPLELRLVEERDCPGCLRRAVRGVLFEAPVCAGH